MYNWGVYIQSRQELCTVVRMSLTLHFELQLVALLLLVGAREHEAVLSPTTSSNKTVLHLLYRPPQKSGWNLTSDSVARSELSCVVNHALEQINRDLSGLELELIEVGTGACSSGACTYASTDTLVDVVRALTQGEYMYNIPGIVGFVPITETQVLSSFVERNKISLIIVYLTRSYAHWHKIESPQSFSLLPPLSIYINTLLNLTLEFGWKRLCILSSEDHLSASEAFVRVYTNNNLKLLLLYFSWVHSALDQVQKYGYRVIVVSSYVSTTSDLVCTAIQKGITWPGYTWIFYDLMLEELEELLVHCECGQDEIRTALKGSLFIHSSRRYDTPKPIEAYNGECLRDSGSQNIVRANDLYNVVWKLAVALNQSIELLQGRDISFHFGQGENQRNITQHLVQHLEDLFDTPYTVTIFQVYNGSALVLAQYDSAQGLPHINLMHAIGDRLKRVQESAAIPSIMLIVVAIACTLFIFVLNILFCYFRNTSEIKASSPQLTGFMFLGVYLQLAASISTSTSGIIFVDGVYGALLCGIILWGSMLGLNFILATLLMRLTRIYRIFSYFGKLSKHWRDTKLSAVIIGIVSVEVLLLVLWSAIDTLRSENFESYNPHTTPPHYTVVQYCSCQYIHIWVLLVLGEVGIVSSVVIILAFKTRKIRRQQFKDTKKVNIFIFSITTTICIMTPLWMVLRMSSRSNEGKLVFAMQCLLLPIYCTLFLFLPKVWPFMCKKLKNNVPKRKVNAVNPLTGNSPLL